MGTERRKNDPDRCAQARQRVAGPPERDKRPRSRAFFNKRSAAIAHAFDEKTADLTPTSCETAKPESACQSFFLAKPQNLFAVSVNAVDRPASPVTPVASCARPGRVSCKQASTLRAIIAVINFDNGLTHRS